MDIEKEFGKIKNLVDFREIVTRSEMFLTKEKVKTLSRLLTETDEDASDYDELLSEIKKLNSVGKE